MLAKIYRPARSAMQSGYAKTKHWVLEFTPEEKPVDPLMGWIGSRETVSQVRLTFETREEAVAYAERHGIAYQVQEPKRRGRMIRPGGYGDNFSPQRRVAWTH